MGVNFDGERATGVRVELTDGWERDVTTRFVVDASGRRCFLQNSLKRRQKDTLLNQFCIYSWFRNVEPNPPGYEGMLFLHFLDLERCWAWCIPLRGGLTSVGIVTDKKDFQTSGRSHEEFFGSLVGSNRSFQWAMRNAERVKPWWIEADYSYEIDQLAGPGWILVGDALRFVDPVFSTGVDVAMYSASFGFDALDSVLRGERPEDEALAEYSRIIGDGVEAWYELITMFYKLRNLFTASAVRKRFRENVVRILQGNLYTPEALQRARDMIAWMKQAYRLSMSDPDNLLAPRALLGAPAVTGPGGSTLPAAAGWDGRRSTRSSPAR
jgi:FADH2 O2-dependent halogenase